MSLLAIDLLPLSKRVDAIEESQRNLILSVGHALHELEAIRNREDLILSAVEDLIKITKKNMGEK